jgi:hypothetical protein
MFQMFYIFFRHSLHVFYLDVANVSHICCNVLYGCCICLQWFSIVFKCFASVADTCCKCFSCFVCMLQVFYLDVSKVDRVLHILQCVAVHVRGGAKGWIVLGSGMGSRGRWR